MIRAIRNSIFLLASGLFFGSAPDMQAQDTYKVVLEGKQKRDGYYSAERVFEIERMPEGSYLKNKIYVKTKYNKAISADSKAFISPVLQNSIVDLGISNISQPYAAYENPNDESIRTTEVSRIYEVSFEADIDAFDICKALMTNPEVEYAVPIYIRHESEYTPNDYKSDKNWWGESIDIVKAWGITKGSDEVVIGIIDSGTDITHEDLAANIWTNPGEIPNNNKDDDGNGKVDDVHGWDMIGNIDQNKLYSGQYEEDNDPTPKYTNNHHGTHVAGCAAAIGDNSKGAVGPAYNCKILPVKCSPDQGGMGIVRGYESILYAAKLGADVINCSWGGAGDSPAELEIIEEALSYGTIILAASGNGDSWGSAIDNDVIGHYPANYEGVISIGASGKDDKPTGFSNYGNSVDIFAPGKAIYSTVPGNKYSNQDGTSMATPVASGVFALVKSVHPDWTADQIWHQVKATANVMPTYTKENRLKYYGLINAYKAVYYNNQAFEVPSLQAENVLIKGKTALDNYEQNEVSIDIKNYLANAKNASIQIEVLSPFISIDKNSFEFASIGENQTETIDLKVQLNERNPWYDGFAELMFTIEADKFETVQRVKIPIEMNSNTKAIGYNVKRVLGQYWTSTRLQDVSVPDNSGFWIIKKLPYYNFIFIKRGNTVIPRQVNKIINHVHAMDQKSAFVLYNQQGGLYTAYTNDYAESWKDYEVATGNFAPVDIHFFDSENGLIISNPDNSKFGVFTSTNSGEKWKQNTGVNIAQENEEVLGVSYHQDNAIFWTNKGRYFASNSKGQAWKMSTTFSGKTIYKMGFINKDTCFAVYKNNNDILVAVSPDYGKSWDKNVYDYSKLSRALPSLIYSPPRSNVATIVTENGEVFTTKDLGETWSTLKNVWINDKMAVLSAVQLKDNFKLSLLQFSADIAELQYSYDPADAIKKLSLTSNEDVDYGEVDLSKSKKMNIKLLNDGEGTIQISDMRIEAGEGTEEGEFEITSEIPAEIENGQSVWIKVEFLPKSEGIKKAKFICDSDSQDGSIVVNLTGEGEIPVSVSSMIEEENNVKIIPNIVSDKASVIIESETSSINEIKIIDVNGKIVKLLQKNLNVTLQNQINFDVNDLLSGKYFLLVDFNGKYVIKEFIVKQ